MLVGLNRILEKKDSNSVEKCAIIKITNQQSRIGVTRYGK